MKVYRSKFLVMPLFLLCATSFSSLAQEQAVQQSQNTLTTEEKQEGWKLLFNGKSLDGWHVFQQPEATSAWEVQNETLTVNLKASGVQHGDLASDEVYENYELRFEWKTPDNGNSGVFINVQEDDENQIAWQTGPEYQLLGPAHVDNKKPAKRPGCLYGFSPQLTDTQVRANGEWNQSMIKQVDGKVEFYLNGNLTAKVDLNSQQWSTWVSQSGFKDLPAFGKSSKGHIVLQEWTSPVWFRNIRILAL